MENILKRLDLNYLAGLLTNCEDEDRAEEILQEYAKKYMVEVDTLEEILATEWNYIKCSYCGRFFGEDEISKDIEDECIYCVEEEIFYEND